MQAKRRLSRSALDVLAALLQDPTSELYGREIAQIASIFPGSLYPILQRFEDDEIVAARWEDVDPVAAGRPRRRYYTLTSKGVAFARKELAAVSERWGVRVASGSITSRWGVAP